MSKKLEALKIEFAKTLQDSDYKFLCDYDRVETCIEVICNSDLIPRKTKFKFFRFKENERILIQADKRFLIEYSIQQNGTKFELYELILSKYNEFERKINDIL
jgi:hypothetical protein